MNKRPHIKILSSRTEKTELPANLSGLAKSHRLIMIERHKEIQFMKLCAQIHFDDFRQKRSDMQRDERRVKRLKNVTTD
jgi:hypothetical protein